MAEHMSPSEVLKLKRVRSVAKATCFVQRHRFVCAFVPLFSTFALFGWTLLHIQGASDPPQLFGEQHNLGVAYELFGTVASRNLADASSSNDYSGSASDGYSVPNIIYPTATPVLEPTPRPVSQPSPEPTLKPTQFPTPKPSAAGVVVTEQPTAFPLPFPTLQPYLKPSAAGIVVTEQPTAFPQAFPTLHPYLKPSAAGIVVTEQPTAFPQAFPTLQPSRQRNSTAPTMQPTSPAAKSTVDVTLLWDLRNVRYRSGSRDENDDGTNTNSSEFARTLDETEQTLLLATCEAVYKDPRLQVVRTRSITPNTICT